MKTKITLIVIILIFITMKMTAQTLWINGVVFTNDGDKAVGIPYATVILYDYENPSKIERVGFTDYTGRYELGKNVISKKYHLSVKARGFKSIDKNLTRLPESHKGNLTLHYEMEKELNSSPINEVVYNPKNDKNDGVKTIKDAILKLGSFKIVDDNVIDDKHKTIRLFICGAHLPASYLEKIFSFPREAIRKIIYTPLGETSDIYGGCINISIEGKDDVSNILNFKPYVAKQFD